MVVIKPLRGLSHLWIKHSQSVMLSYTEHVLLGMFQIKYSDKLFSFCGILFSLLCMNSPSEIWKIKYAYIIKMF